MPLEDIAKFTGFITEEIRKFLQSFLLYQDMNVFGIILNITGIGT